MDTCQVGVMNIDDITRQSLLYDFYGALLTDRQREVMELYHEENYSLAEIADEFGISRQGVHDALHKAEKSLEGYEEKLGLVDKFSRTSRAIDDIDKRISRLTEGFAGDKTVKKELEEIRSIIDKLEE